MCTLKLYSLARVSRQFAFQNWVCTAVQNAGLLEPVGPGGHMSPLWFLEVKLTLFQPGEAYYAHQAPRIFRPSYGPEMRMES